MQYENCANSWMAADTMNIFFFKFFAYFKLGHMNVAKLLIDTGADVNIKDEDGDIALHYCAIYGNNIVFEC